MNKDLLMLHIEFYSWLEILEVFSQVLAKFVCLLIPDSYIK